MHGANMCWRSLLCGQAQCRVSENCIELGRSLACSFPFSKHPGLSEPTQHSLIASLRPGLNPMSSFTLPGRAGGNAGTSRRCSQQQQLQQTASRPAWVRTPQRQLQRCRTAMAEDVELSEEKRTIQKILDRPYKHGFKTIIESDTFPKGLSEDVVRAISAKKGEPEWMLEFRLKAFRKWLTMEEPKWSDNAYPEIDYQDISYYSEPKVKEKLQSLDEVDPELLKTFEKLGIPLNEQKRLANVAVDAVFDSVSIATTFKEDLKKHGVIFCSISEALKEYPEMVKKYMGSVVGAPACPTGAGNSCCSWPPSGGCTPMCG